MKSERFYYRSLRVRLIKIVWTARPGEILHINLPFLFISEPVNITKQINRYRAKLRVRERGNDPNRGDNVTRDGA